MVAATTTFWSYASNGVNVPFGPEVSRKLEDAFQAFWCSDKGSGTLLLEPSPLQGGCTVDFQVIELICIDSSDSKLRVRSPILRRQDCVHDRTHRGYELDLQSATSSCTSEWGYGQDVLDGKAFCPYSYEISTLLEDGFAKFKAGKGLKGIMFTSSNGADYVVDFEKMQQIRVITRRVRPVYRHGLAPGVRTAGVFRLESEMQVSDLGCMPTKPQPPLWPWDSPSTKELSKHVTLCRSSVTAKLGRDDGTSATKVCLYSGPCLCVDLPALVGLLTTLVITKRTA